MIFSKRKENTKKISLFSSEKNTNQVQRYSIKIFFTQITNSTKIFFAWIINSTKNFYPKENNSNLTFRYHKQNNSLSLSSEAHKSQPTLLEMDLKKFYHIWSSWPMLWKNWRKNKLEMEESHKYKELDHNNDVLLPNLKKKQTWKLSMLIWYRNNNAFHQR